ncbi:mediator of RNA polymerase II transcription subunit 16-like [Dendronephthya gigantea]|uniref:mediator of RNA polymerase II transcription subunit 16-like n=1 Tax=Dendronephthya gigantea TaxID=151771 RepID=UPI00106A691F|nr:mediator of RNA polymerase II transcription subunit 16-like [Dendronephthya gigantea]
MAMPVMELVPVYRADQPLKDGKNRHSFRAVRSSWSSINQFAFSSQGLAGELTASKSSNEEHYFHIVDPNKPWDLFSMVSGHSDTITDLQWNSSGTNLLSVDNSGVFKLWGMKNCLINDWECKRTVSVEEKIICMSWLGSSAKYLFGDVPRDLNQLMASGNSQSFPRNKAKHPLTNACGITNDGWIAVTETGKVYFVSVNSDIPMAKAQIDTDLMGIQVADISFSNDGRIIVGLADGLVGSVARFYKVTLCCTSSNTVNITCTALQTLSPYSNKSAHPYAITHIKFVYKNSGAHVFICSKGLLESYIERWQLTIEAQQLHELCQKQQPHKHPPPIKTWIFLSHHVVRKHIASVAVPWLPVDPEKNLSSTQYPRHNLILGFADGHIRALNSLNLSSEGELTNLDHFPSSYHQAKRLKTSFSGHTDAFLSLHLSPSSCCLMGITGSGSLYLLKCEQNAAVSHIHNSVALENLLKYSMMSGWDIWDVMVVLKHQHDDILDATLKLLEQDYKTLPQSQINRKFLSIKANLLSLYRDSPTKVMDCYSKQFLLALSNFFKSLVPIGAEKLAGICEQAVEIDPETVFQNLDLKEFEIDLGVLKTLGPLCQWLADFTLSFFGILLVKQGQEAMPGASLLRDNICILLLKQLLLLVLIWSKQSAVILPYCIGSIEKHEYVVQLFKLVSRLWLCNHQKVDIGEIENSVTDLESYFSNHLNFLYQSMLMTPTNQGITGKQAYLKPDEPDVYEFGDKPRDRMLPLRLLTTQYSGHVDVVTKQFLGNASDRKLRQCTKCEGISLLTHTVESQAENAWERKWTASCVCGGAWKRVQPG